jgi:DmsE family decaheme c-type cytochrome
MNDRKNLSAIVQALALTAAFTVGVPASAQDSRVVDQQCASCHGSDEHVMAITQTPHGSKGNKAGPTCTTCHGESQAHMQSGNGSVKPDRTFSKGTKTTPDQRAAVCMSCHGSNRHLAFWESGRHRKNDVACDNCHALHTPAPPGARVALKTPNPSVTPYQTTVRTLEYETCTSCHRQIRSQLLKPSHHPIIEGRITCSDCHNPHGALTRAMVRQESINQQCTSCHAEKRGPYVWEHPPVEENCLTCHNPHGSNHNRLLAERAPNLCQDCHDASRHPGTIYGGDQGFANPAPNTRLIARGCVNCHFNVHGSNAPAMRGKFFLR